MSGKSLWKLQKIIVLLLVYNALFCFSCSNNLPSLNGIDTVQISTYNVQTFFDSVVAGTEYDDFKGSKSSWSEDKYKVRLQRLCTLLEKMDSDIVILQEIENEKILQDINNNLVTQSDSSRAFTQALFVPSRYKTLGCALLSRFPILGATSHAVYYQHISSSPPDMRPLVEASINCGFTVPLTIFAGHWKSKAGDDELSGFWRSSQEKILEKRITQINDGLFVFCGDCNKGIEEFYCDGKYVSLGMDENDLSQNTPGVRVYSPWLFEEYKSLNGSYYYQNEWEKIDHFFLGMNLSLLLFKREDKGEHVDVNSVPIRYSVWNGKGYSDHLPLTCVVMEKK